MPTLLTLLHTTARKCIGACDPAVESTALRAIGERALLFIAVTYHCFLSISANLLGFVVLALLRGSLGLPKSYLHISLKGNTSKGNTSFDTPLFASLGRL